MTHSFAIVCANEFLEKPGKLKKTSFDGCSAYESNYALLPHLRMTAKCAFSYLPSVQR